MNEPGHGLAAPTFGGRRDVEREQAALVRELFGNPFSSPAVAPAWLTWQAGTIPMLAQALYDERRFADLPVLADALE
jgi:hypothetical protein